MTQSSRAALFVRVGLLVALLVGLASCSAPSRLEPPDRAAAAMGPGAAIFESSVVEDHFWELATQAGSPVGQPGPRPAVISLGCSPAPCDTGDEGQEAPADAPVAPVPARVADVPAGADGEPEPDRSHAAAKVRAATRLPLPTPGRP